MGLFNRKSKFDRLLETVNDSLEGVAGLAAGGAGSSSRGRSRGVPSGLKSLRSVTLNVGFSSLICRSRAPATAGPRQGAKGLKLYSWLKAGW